MKAILPVFLISHLSLSGSTNTTPLPPPNTTPPPPHIHLRTHRRAPPPPPKSPHIHLRTHRRARTPPSNHHTSTFELTGELELTGDLHLLELTGDLLLLELTGDLHWKKLQIEGDMDKRWMEIIDRRLPEYEDGVDRFLDFAFAKMKTDKIKCPCVNCNNYYKKTRADVKGDLLFNGIVMGYTRWIYHGEDFSSSSSDDESNEEGFDDMDNLVRDLYGNRNNDHGSREEPNGNNPNTNNKEAHTFFRLLSDVEQELYPSCDKYSKLSFLVKLFHIKCLSGWSNKSFDMEQLAIRGRLPKEVCVALNEISAFFKNLTAKTVNVDGMEQLQKQIAITLCKLESIYPPAFFDVMVHLAVHLPDEVLIAGPVQYRWMYPIERYLGTLKSYVRNKARPEGSIAEGYIADECLTFCSMYLHGVETKFNRPERNYDGDQAQVRKGLPIFSQKNRVLGQATHYCLSKEEYDQAHMYVLKNCEEVWPFLDKHKEEIEKRSPINVHKRHETEFPRWFETHVTQLHNEGKRNVSEQLLNLARGPDKRVAGYKSCIVNGFRFHVKDRDKQRKTQNSGVVVKGDNGAGSIDYYGVLTDIIELNYIGDNRVVLMKCDWWDVFHKGSGHKKDENGFTLINFSRRLPTNEPYVLACQAEQVYYVSDSKSPNWHVVIKNDPRNFYDIPFGEDEENSAPEDVAYQQERSSSALDPSSASCDNNISVQWRRTDISATHVDPSLVMQEQTIDEEECEWVDEEEEADDTFIDEKATLVLEEVEKLASTPQEDGSILSEDESFSRVLGEKSGYVRGLGAGPKPKTMSKLKYNRVELDKEFDSRLQSMRAEIQTEMEAQVEARVEAQLEIRVQARMSQMQSDFQAELHDMRATFEQQMRQLLSPR